MMEIRLEEIEKKVGIEITFRSIAKGKYKLWLGKFKKIKVLANIFKILRIFE